MQLCGDLRTVIGQPQRLGKSQVVDTDIPQFSVSNNRSSRKNSIKVSFLYAFVESYECPAAPNFCYLLNLKPQ